MAESGTLEEIISQYLTLNSLIVFENIEDMKSATNLVNGTNVKTLGFYNMNDGGNAEYKVRNITNDDVVDDVTIIALENNLVAELVINDIVNIKKFGVKNDNTDTTIKLQKAIDYAVTKNIKKIYIPSGDYLISSLKLANNVNSIDSFELYGDGMYNTTLKSINNNNTITGLIDFSNCMRCSIHDITLQGNKSNNVSEFDGIYVNSNQRMTGINIYNVTVSNFSKNGIYLNSIDSYIMDSYFNNVICNSNNKNGFLLNRATDSRFNNCISFNNKENGFEIFHSSNHFNNCKAYLNGIFDGVTTDPSITPEGATNDYLKRYNGFLIHSARNIFTCCEAQENYGHGFVIQQGSNNILVGCNADANGICGFDLQGNRITRANYSEEPVYSGFFIDRCAYTLIEGVVQNFIQSSQGTSQKYAVSINTSSNSNVNLIVSDTPELYNLENVSFKSTHLTFNNKVYDVQEIDLTDALTLNIEGASLTNRSHVYLRNNNEIIYNLVMTLTDNLENNNSISVLTFKTGYRPKNAYQNGYLAVSSNQYSNQSPHYNEINTSGVLATNNNEDSKKAITLSGRFFIN